MESATSSRLRREGRSWYSGDELDLLDLGSEAIPAGYGLIRYTAALLLNRLLVLMPVASLVIAAAFFAASKSLSDLEQSGPELRPGTERAYVGMVRGDSDVRLARASISHFFVGYASSWTEPDTGKCWEGLVPETETQEFESILEVWADPAFLGYPALYPQSVEESIPWNSPLIP